MGKLILIEIQQSGSNGLAAGAVELRCLVDMEGATSIEVVYAWPKFIQQQFTPILA